MPLKKIALALLVIFLLAGCVAPEEEAIEEEVDLESLDADLTALEEDLQDLNELEGLEVPDINEDLFA